MSVARQAFRIGWILAIVGTICFWAYIGVAELLFPDLNPVTGTVNRDSWTNHHCDRSGEHVVESPDGARRAVRMDFACGGFGGASLFTAVGIVPRDRIPSVGDEVFVGGEYDKDTVRLEWKSPKNLQITVPNSAEIYMRKDLHWGILVEIKFDPDDPIAREKLLREREERAAKSAEETSRRVKDLIMKERLARDPRH